MITNAAIKYNDLIFTGKNHADILFKIITTISYDDKKRIDGFVDDKGNFLTRRVAADHAFEVGQIPEKKFELFSSDLEK